MLVFKHVQEQFLIVSDGKSSYVVDIPCILS